MPKLLIFAGTTEGRQLVETLSKNKEIQVFASVATEYGKALLPDGIPNVTIKSGRMIPEEMVCLLQKEHFDMVIDTTHPYAVLVTENIKEACIKTNTTYIRLLRASTNLAKESHNQNESSKELSKKVSAQLIYVENTIEAAEYLDKTEGTVLLTTGSKELEAFTKVKDYKERLYPRVLPTPEVLQKCFDLGYEGKHLICMQGPFTYEMNCALLKKTNASYMVTKDSGKVGGFDEKYQAAMDIGVSVILIGRKKDEQGLSLEEVLELIQSTYGMKLETEIPISESSEKVILGKTLEHEEKNGWFPLFMNLAGKNVMVIGAGSIAKRRVKSLSAFSCNITVIAKEADTFFLKMQEENKLNVIIKEYQSADIKDANLVIAATNDRFTNHKIAEFCKQRQILVNVVDCKEECDFYFPGVIKHGDLTVGVTAGGKNHGLAKTATAAIKTYLENWNRSSAKLEESKNGTKKN